MGWLASLRRQGWLLATAGVFVVQNHCGTPGVEHGELAVHLLERGQYERALREARRAIREDPDDIDMRVVAALAHAGRDELDRSVAVLADALARDPEQPRLYAALRSLCDEETCAGSARDAFTRLRDAHPDNWYLDVNLAWATSAAGSAEEAVPLLEAAVAAVPEGIDEAEQIFAHHHLSRLYLDTGRYADAARTLEGALLLRPDDPGLLISTGECHLRQGDETAARELFDRALDATGQRARAASQIAQVHYALGLTGGAIHYYELAAAEAQVTPLILNNLAWTYAENGLELERAEQLSLRAVKSDAENVVYLDTYAEVLFRRGRVDHAIALMKRAIALEPEGGEHFDYLRDQLVRFESGSSALP